MSATPLHLLDMPSLTTYHLMWLCLSPPTHTHKHTCMTCHLLQSYIITLSCLATIHITHRPLCSSSSVYRSLDPEHHHCGRLQPCHQNRWQMHLHSQTTPQAQRHPCCSMFVHFEQLCMHESCWQQHLCIVCFCLTNQETMPCASPQKTWLLAEALYLECHQTMPLLPNSCMSTQWWLETPLQCSILGNQAACFLLGRPLPGQPFQI